MIAALHRSVFSSSRHRFLVVRAVLFLTAVLSVSSRPASFLASADTVTPSASSKMGLPSGYQSLFNGTDYEGWHGRPTMAPKAYASMSEEEKKSKKVKWDEETAKHWSVVDGVLINDGLGPYLVTNDSYENYELFIRYRIKQNTDSGIYLKDNPQVQIWDPTNPNQFKHGNFLGSGGLWNNAAGAAGKDPFFPADRPAGQWNEMRIRQLGSRTTVILNGHEVVHHATMRNYWDKESPFPRKGGIHLQTHGGEIHFRDIGIKTFSSDEANGIMQTESQALYRSLFNGADLSGWVGSVDSYEVVDGAIQCKKGSGGNLLTEEEFENFVVRLEFKLPPAGNNGLAIRAPLNVSDPAYAAMCELQVLDTEHQAYKTIDDRQAHGSAYGMVAAKRGYLRPTGEWNFQEVTVNGSAIKVELNGYVILDTDLAPVTDFMGDRPHPGKDRTKGHFGFAGHSAPVMFRNISIRPLPPTAASATK